MSKTVITGLVLIVSTIASAHPGRTASDGCHYCRTNCGSWGVPWNERHCHGSSLTSKCINVEYLGTYCAPPGGGIIDVPYLGVQCGKGQCIDVPYLGVRCSSIPGGRIVNKPYLGLECDGECVPSSSSLCIKR